MLPRNLEELDRVKNECFGMVTQRAALSAGGTLVPLPGVDIAVDVGLLMELLPAINRRFGLAKDQIEEFDPRLKIFIYQVIIDIGGKLVGQVITKQLLMQILKRVGIRVAAKSVAKFIPFLGQADAAGLSFGAMTIVGNSHVMDCYRVAEHIIKNEPPQA
jgi:hypothetical protein